MCLLDYMTDSEEPRASTLRKLADKFADGSPTFLAQLRLIKRYREKIGRVKLQWSGPGSSPFALSTPPAAVPVGP
jgi:hypothetical protein